MVVVPSAVGRFNNALRRYIFRSFFQCASKEKLQLLPLPSPCHPCPSPARLRGQGRQGGQAGGHLLAAASARLLVLYGDAVTYR